MNEIPYLKIIEDLKTRKKIMEDGIEAFLHLWGDKQYQPPPPFISVGRESGYDRGMGIGYY